jgi:hypothetical protein
LKLRNYLLGVEDLLTGAAGLVESPAAGLAGVLVPVEAAGFLPWRFTGFFVSFESAAAGAAGFEFAGAAGWAGVFWAASRVPAAMMDRIKGFIFQVSFSFYSSGELISPSRVHVAMERPKQPSPARGSANTGVGVNAGKESS